MWQTCVYIYIYMYVSCIHRVYRVYHNILIFVCVYTYIYIYIYTHTYMHACMHTYIHACIHTYQVAIRSDTEKLPTASTCFNTLKLPTYSSWKVMKTKLEYVITQVIIVIVIVINMMLIIISIIIMIIITIILILPSSYHARSCPSRCALTIEARVKSMLDGYVRISKQWQTRWTNNLW